MISNFFSKEKEDEELTETNDNTRISILNAIGSADSQNVGRLIKDGVIVVLNTEGISNQSEMTYLLTFCEGLACGVNGTFSKASSHSYILAPQRINIQNLIDAF